MQHSKTPASPATFMSVSGSVPIAAYASHSDYLSVFVDAISSEPSQQLQNDQSASSIVCWGLSYFLVLYVHRNHIWFIMVGGRMGQGMRARVHLPAHTDPELWAGSEGCLTLTHSLANPFL